MILVGDIAHPFDTTPRWTWPSPPWPTQPMVANLEGSICEDISELPNRRLFNHISIVPALAELGVQVALLSNNHVMDLPHRIRPTVSILSDSGIGTAGAGPNRSKAARTAGISENGDSSRILNFGWRPIGCPAATRRGPGVNPLTPLHVLSSIRSEKTTHPDTSIVVTVHWNYEMELYPQPAHRELAFACVEAGADLVVGHHPHRVGGFEYHQERLIVYSLGNFWLPQGAFFDGAVSFDEDADLELALEWHANQYARAHWFRYRRKPDRLEYLTSEDVKTSPELTQRTPFAGMSHSEYKEWFSVHRLKRRLLPIYRDFNSTLQNNAKDMYVANRHRALVALEQIGWRSRLEARRP